MENMKKEMVCIYDVKLGDTIEHEGKLKTVGRESIRRCPFVGVTLWGDSYFGGQKKSN